MMDLFTLRVMLDELARLELIMGLCFIGTGLVFGLMGFRLFKVLIVVSFGVIGFIIGDSLGSSLGVGGGLELLFGFVGALGLALFSVYLVKISVAILAGGWAGLAVVMVVNQFASSQLLLLVCGLAAFIVVASLTLVMYQEIIIFVTSLEGALLFLGGLAVFVSRMDTLWGHLRRLLLDTPIFAPFLLVAGTVTAYYLQLADLSKKKSGMSG